MRRPNAAFDVCTTLSSYLFKGSHSVSESYSASWICGAWVRVLTPSSSLYVPHSLPHKLVLMIELATGNAPDMGTLRDQFRGSDHLMPGPYFFGYCGEYQAQHPGIVQLAGCSLAERGRYSFTSSLCSSLKGFRSASNIKHHFQSTISLSCASRWRKPPFSCQHLYPTSHFPGIHKDPRTNECWADGPSDPFKFGFALGARAGYYWETSSRRGYLGVWYAWCLWKMWYLQRLFCG